MVEKRKKRTHADGGDLTDNPESVENSAIDYDRDKSPDPNRLTTDAKMDTEMQFMGCGLTGTDEVLDLGKRTRSIIIDNPRDERRQTHGNSFLQEQIEQFNR